MSRILKSGIVGLIIIILLIVIHYVSWFQPVEDLAIKIISPIQKPCYNALQSVNNFRTNWFTKRDLIAENEKITDELIGYQIDRSKLNSLEQENDLLKAELSFVEEHDIQHVSAQIITGVSDPSSQSVIINRGSKQGIELGMAVVAEEGVLVGKIHEVSDYYSKVLLLTDNQSRVAVTIQNQEQTIGLVEGQFGLSIAMTNIPQTAEIAEGDLIVTSGLEGQIPKDLLIAKIETISQIESEIFKTAILSPIIPFDNLSYVLVIIP